jgi:hypothetical protein
MGFGEALEWPPGNAGMPGWERGLEFALQRRDGPVARSPLIEQWREICMIAGSNDCRRQVVDNAGGNDSEFLEHHEG